MKAFVSLETEEKTFSGALSLPTSPRDCAHFALSHLPLFEVENADVAVFTSLLSSPTHWRQEDEAGIRHLPPSPV